MKKVKVLGIVGSSRNRGKREDLIDTLNQCASYQDLYNAIYEISSAKKMSNSEAIVMAALYGARTEGADIDLLRLSDHIRDVETLQVSSDVLRKVQHSDGLVFSSPVYFGDRSSYVSTFMNILRSSDELPLIGKTVGFVSVGAKRNGGQETTNIFGLYDSLQLGASVVGNGPPTAQYGGTAWAGDIGSIVDDNYGLQTSLNTGSRVAEVSRILKHKVSEKAKKQRILVLLGSEDKKGFIRQLLESAFEGSSAEIEIEELFKRKIHRCIGCSVCPQETDEFYKCIFKDDEMRELHASVRNSDGILFAGNFGDGQLIDSYQIFIERMRFIRRNHFELTNMPVSSCHVEKIGMNSIFHMRVLTSMIRHNAIYVGPQYIGIRSGHAMIHNQEPRKFGHEFIKKTRVINAAIRAMMRRSTSYEPIGYGQHK